MCTRSRPRKRTNGASAGVALVAAMVSSFTGRAVRPDLAMTGESTLSGHVLPVAGVKEKVYGACRRGLARVVLPRRNEKHFERDVGGDVRRRITVHYVRRVDDLLDLVLLPVEVAGARPPEPPGTALAVRRWRDMVEKSVFALGWRSIGSSRRRWQLQVCGDVTEAARLAAGLARFDGGGRWRVYDIATVPEGGGSVALARRHLVAQGVVRPPVR